MLEAEDGGRWAAAISRNELVVLIVEIVDRVLDVVHDAKVVRVGR
jgi:hypothetical protein